MKAEKTRLQILVDVDDLVFLHKFADRTHAKNASVAIHELIYSFKLMEESIQKFKEKLIAETKKQTYEEVRTDQIKKEDQKKSLYDKPEWQFLKGTPEDPNKKSVVKLKRPKK